MSWITTKNDRKMFLSYSIKTNPGAYSQSGAP